MPSKIIFLGTGGDAIVVGKQHLASGGIILQSGDNQFHIDPGPGSLVRAKEFNVHIRNNIAVLVSHSHINHCSDVNAVINAMTHGGLDRYGVIVSNKTAFEGSEENPAVISNFHKGCVEKCIVLESGHKVGINDVDIVATRTNHTDTSAIGFRITTPDFCMAYTSDTGYSPDLAQDYKGADVLILNVVYPDDAQDPHNLSTEDAAKLCSDVKPKLAIITHFGVKMMNIDTINQARIIQRKSGVQTIAAKDGLAVNPISRDTNVRRRIEY
jgi:ribonuclease BN (tRNA processing enzyme)